MDLGIIAAIVMLVVWAVAAFGFDAPGWAHLLLTLGLFLLFWRVAARGSRPPTPPPGASDGATTPPRRKAR